MSQQTETIIPMSIEEFNTNTTILLQKSYQSLLTNEQTIQQLLLHLDNCIEKEQMKIHLLDQNIEKCETLITTLSDHFQTLFNN